MALIRASLGCLPLSISLNRYNSPTDKINFLVILMSYLVSVKWANRLTVAHVTLTIIFSVFLLIVWAVTVGLFTYHDRLTTSSDLWSRSCANSKSNVENSGDVNWGRFCIEQVHLVIPIDLMKGVGANLRVPQHWV